MKYFFKVSQTFSEVTPESAADGEHSDSGFEIDERQDDSIRDILRLIKDQGNEELQLFGNTLRIYGCNSTSCYHTGTERQLCLHIEGSKRNLERLYKIVLK